MSEYQTQKKENVDLIDDDVRNQMLLNLIPGVGPKIRRSLFECFENAEEILDAPQSHLKQVPGVGAKLAKAISAARDEIDIDATIELCREHQFSILCENDEAYPNLLKEIHDPPGILYVSGKLESRDSIAIAIVGTPNPGCGL